MDAPALILIKHHLLFGERGMNETRFDIVAAHLVATLQELQVPFTV
jgi:hypothetical protein